MSQSGYDDYVNSMSDNKIKEENLYSNFGVDSFDENNTSTNQAIKSGKKDDDAKASHKFSLNNIPEGSVISETQEFVIEKNTKINNQSSGFKISKFTGTEKEILKEKEKEKEIEKIKALQKEKEKEIHKAKEKKEKDNSFFNKTSISSSRRNSKNIVTRPLIKKVSELQIDLDKIKKNLTDKKNIEYLEKVISDLKEENQKLIEQGDREFQKKVDEIDNLKKRYENEIQKIENETENKINELKEKEKLNLEELEKEKKIADEQVEQEEKNIKELHKKTLELKENELENEKEILKIKFEYEMKDKKDILKKEQEENERLMMIKNKNQNQFDQVFQLLNQQTTIKEDYEKILKKNEKISNEINDIEKQIEIQNKILLNIKEELYSTQNENQRQIYMLQDELNREKKIFNNLERNIKREQINYNENFEKKRMELKYGKMGNDMKLEIFQSKLNSKKNEIERERKILENNKIHLENYQKREMMFIENQENELDKKKKKLDEIKLLILSKRKIIEDKKKYIFQKNENNKKESEDINLEKQKLENDKNDIKIAFDRIQSTINNLNEERRKVDLEKINIMKKYQELENKRTTMMNQKESLYYKKNNIDMNVKAVDNFNFNYINYIPNNNQNGKINEKPLNNTYNNNFYSEKNQNNFTAEQYFNNLTKQLNNKK